MIEGYSHDPERIEGEWRQLDAMFATTATEIVHVPGNHDVSNLVQRRIWLQRYGSTYSHFRHRDVLFCILDTQDPPPPYEVPQTSPTTRTAPLTPRQERLELERHHDWDGTQPAHLSETQLVYWDTVLAEHRDARWTVLCMHMPLWQGQHPAWTRLRATLGDRPYSAFAGHVHNYRHDVIGGRSHVRLGPTGGMWVVGGPEGNFDHVTQVTMTPDGPMLANILLDGVRDVDGQPLSPVATRSVPIF